MLKGLYLASRRSLWVFALHHGLVAGTWLRNVVVWVNHFAVLNLVGPVERSSLQGGRVSVHHLTNVAGIHCSKLVVSRPRMASYVGSVADAER